MEKTLVIIPAFNEESSIGSLCKSLKEKDFDILVLDDSSIDKTAKIARSNGAEVISNTTNIGYHSNLYKGLYLGLEKGYSKAITMDADGQHRIKDLEAIADRLNAGYDLVMGVRNKFNRESEEYIALLSQKLFNITDPLCGLKGYKLKSLKNFEFPEDDTIATSVAIYLVEKGFTHIEIPIQILGRNNGHSVLGEDDVYTNYCFLKKFMKNLERLKK